MAPLKSFHSDLVVEILAKLPVKSLLRFRCVSKSWDITITDPVFSKLRQTRPCLFIISNEGNGPLRFTCLSNEALLADSCDGIDGAVTYVYVPWGTNPYRFHNFDVMGCCNGLVCVYINSTAETLWNPSTRKFKTLPPLMSFGDKFPCFCGFGYDEVTDDYKVVKGFVDDVLIDVRDHVFVYSLKSDAWRRVPNSNIGSSVPADLSGVLLGGALHWLEISRKIIIAFDLAKEKFEVLPRPETGISLTKLGVLGEHLCLCSKELGRGGVDVWIMKEYGVMSSWTKMFRVPLETLCRYEYNYEYICDIYYVPLLFSKEDEIVAMVSGTGVAVVRCNTRDMRFKDLMLWPNNHVDYAFLCTESLVSPLVNHQA